MKKIILKVKEHLVEDGLKETAYRSVHYILRQFRIRMEKKSDYLKMKIPSKEIPFFTQKQHPTVYIAAVVPYYDIGGGQRCSQLAKTFNKMGYTVKYLYTSSSNDKKEQKISIPLDMHMFLNEKALKHVRNTVQKDDLFIFEAPVVQFEKLLDIAVEKECKIVYESIDNWETSLGKDFFNEDMLKKILTTSDILVGTAQPLVEQLEYYLEKFHINKEHKKILYLPNAVDEELFCGVKKCEMPDDLVKGVYTFLYYGSLWGEWFSWDLVIGLAKKHPEYSINLIGNTEGVSKIMRECPENIHFLGLKAQMDLPMYLQHVDYALLPFDRGEIGDYVSPLKVFEYISMYARVISTSLPDVKGYPNVYFGDTVEEWEQIILENNAVDKESADEFIDNNTWFTRISAMIQNLYTASDESILKGKLAIVILNYNNKNIIIKCINSLLRYNSLYQYEIIVVDNGSSDGSYELLKERYSPEEISLYKNQKNGCSSGRNLGVLKTEKEYVMFLDSDQWITNRYWLKPYEQIISKHKEFGAIGWAAGFFNPSGTACYTVDEFPYRYMPPRMLCRTDIGYLGSGGMLMKTSNFNAVEGFDLFYDPTCYEDTDISLKMRDAQKEIYYCPYLGVIHLPHQTTNAGTEEHNKLIRAKKDYFVEKWRTKNPELLKYVK